MAKFEYMERAFSSELRPRARLVLQVLVLHCNKEGECFPSIKTRFYTWGEVRPFSFSGLFLCQWA